MAGARFTYCVFTIERYGPPPERNIETIARFPESGWLEGSLSDLADTVRLVSVPQREVEQAADRLGDWGIEYAAAGLDEMTIIRPYLFPNIATLLGMADIPQTRRMACAIVANALIFPRATSPAFTIMSILLLRIGGGDRLQLMFATLEAGRRFWPSTTIPFSLLRGTFYCTYRHRRVPNFWKSCATPPSK